MELPGRKLSVVLRRNESKDERVGVIEYTGYDAHWPSGHRIHGLAFDRFCKIGVRYLLGRDKPGVAPLDLYFVPLPDRETRLPRVPGLRLRVLYLERNGPRLQMFLSDETPTDIVFDLERDEEAVLEWVGGRDIPDGARQWFGLCAVKREEEERAFPPRRRARRPDARAACTASPVHRRSPLREEGPDDAFPAP